MRRLAHLGPRGTYTEAAAALYDPAAELVPVPTVSDAVAAVERGEADACVCALENSLEGGVRDTLDQLLRDELAVAQNRDLINCGERARPMRHNDDDTAAVQDVVERLRQRCNALSIEIRVGLVQDHEKGVAIKGTR